jgi:hypothetical protein
MWKEEILASFELLTQHWHEEIEGTQTPYSGADPWAENQILGLLNKNQ